MISQSNKIELHYFFSDSTHTINAVLRNACEKELLQIFREVTNSLEFDIEIESEAFLEGGLKERWKLIGKNSAQITLIIAVITIILSRIPVENKELVKLQIENLKLDNEIKKEELKKIKIELQEKEIVTNEIVKKVVDSLEKNYKLIWHKSTFYKKLNLYPKVTSLATQQLDDNNNPVDKENLVLREQFGDFILRSDKFPPNVDEEAIIDIISPVLKKGNFQWKGFYNGQILSFEMKDKTFKDSVVNREIEFTNGSAIKCVLKQSRKIDDLGLIQIVNNQVLTVIEIVENDKIIETIQGKKIKRDKNTEFSQLSFDF